MYRIDEFRKRFDGCAMFDNRKNIYYLTGYTGEGCLLVTPEDAVIITDSRYTEQCERQAPECLLEMTKRGESREYFVKKYLAKGGYTSLHVETGVLTVSTYRHIEKELEGITLLDMPGTVGEMRIIKSEEEIKYLCRAAVISCEAFEALLKVIKPGMTEKYVCAVLEHEMRLRGSEGIAFDTIVASGINGSMPHAVPSDKVIENGEMVTFDFGAQVMGYKADMTRTIAVGRLNDELTAIYNAVYTAHMRALEAVKVGAVTKDIDAIARDYLDKLYPGAFGHSLGHGVGLDVHEAPGVNTREDTVLKKGHVITIEPGVYLKGVGGCRIEDTVILTDTGFIDPFTVSKQLIVV